MKKITEVDFGDFPPIGGIIASKMIVDGNIKPRFMYREKRTRPEDSGWRIFTGLETEEYTNDPSNAGIYNPSTILKVDPSIRNILFKGVGSVYEKMQDNTEWYKVTDFHLEDDYIVTHRLTEKLTIEINNLFETKVEDNGDLFYTTGDKSVRMSIWNKIEKSKKEMYLEWLDIIKNRDQTIAETIKTFDFSDKSIARIGYLIKENDGEKNYGVIYGVTIIDNQIIRIALYFDEEGDLDWAIETWKSINMLSPL
jgi:hypothetical protein